MGIPGAMHMMYPQTVPEEPKEQNGLFYKDFSALLSQKEKLQHFKGSHALLLKKPHGNAKDQRPRLATLPLYSEGAIAGLYNKDVVKYWFFDALWHDTLVYVLSDAVLEGVSVESAERVMDRFSVKDRVVERCTMKFIEYHDLVYVWQMVAGEEPELVVLYDDHKGRELNTKGNSLFETLCDLRDNWRTKTELLTESTQTDEDSSSCKHEWEQLEFAGDGDEIVVAMYCPHCKNVRDLPDDPEDLMCEHQWRQGTTAEGSEVVLCEFCGTIKLEENMDLNDLLPDTMLTKQDFTKG